MTSYRYRVLTVLRVVDADTVDLTIDLGLRLTAALRFRVLGVNAPERGTAGADEATAFTAAWLADSVTVDALTHKADSFGRWLADLRRPDGSSLSDALLAGGHAIPYRR